MDQFQQGHVLIVDDNSTNRTLLSRWLVHEGYHVELAEDGSQALELSKDGRFDVILLDVTMPGISGFEVLKILREKYSLTELPVIMVTALDASDDIVMGFHYGANDYVTKPIDFPVLLARLETQLELSKLTKLKDQFLQIASHDLKNPLSNVLLSTFLVLTGVPPGTEMTEEMYSAVQMIERQSTTMQRIVTDFLDFHALQDGRLQLELGWVDLSETARRVVSDNADYAQSKDITFDLDLEPMSPLMADEGRLSQVMQNFIGNAIKFCPRHSAVMIRIRTENQSAIFEVCDSGPGLTEADLAKVFTKYARLSNKPTGGEKSSGLGLAIAKRMIELHGGSIGVTNNPDCGATFWFSLPLEA